MTALEDEARATYARFVATRLEIEAGTKPWSALADFFTDDAVFIDPAWGRFQGTKAMSTFLDDSMVGLEDWSFPEQWTMVEGNRVVSFLYNQLPGSRPDGSPYRVPTISILHYAGEGKFSYDLDILNMAELGEALVGSGWVPPKTMKRPPKVPDRNVTPADGSDSP
ncbi:MAG: SnoaL-like polyketide cyclase [Mycobacterium sp.]|nr:SnoaL-like polyketide cyclase [Mycobacterium sp.]